MGIQNDSGCHTIISFASKALLVIGDVHPALFALTFLQIFLEIKRIVFYQDLGYKAKFSFKSDRLT